MLYSYGIAIALGIQSYWPEIAGYVPVKLRWVLGAATFFVVAGCTHLSVLAPAKGDA